MFVNLLPGLRELRAPLASGYLWLLSGWLLFAPTIPEASTAAGTWSDIYRLGEAVGRSGLLAAATFAAYIVGIFNERIALFLSRRLQVIRTRTPAEAAKLWPYSILRDVVTETLIHRYWSDNKFRVTIQSVLTPHALRHLSEVSPDYIIPMSRFEQFEQVGESDWTTEVQNSYYKELRSIMEEIEQNRYYLGWLLRELINVEGTIEELRQDLPLIPARIVGKEPEIYERWDRFKAEAEFRISIALPLLALTVILAMRLHPTFALLILPCGYLIHDGLEKTRAAITQLAESLRAGRADSPVLERLKSGEPNWRYRPPQLG
jgi:hypothetical protein